MQLSVGTHPKDDNFRPIEAGDELDGNETDYLKADVTTTVMWREVRLGNEGEDEYVTAQPWNARYEISAGRNLGDPDARYVDEAGFGKRRTLLDGNSALEIHIQPKGGLVSEAVTIYIRPKVIHLNEYEALQMAKEIELADYYLDHNAAGLGEKATLKDVLAHASGGDIQVARTPLQRARALSLLWPELESAFAACSRKLPSRPTTIHQMAPAHAGRQNAASLRRNLAEGRVDPEGRSLRREVHVARQTRDFDTPTAAELVKGAHQVNTLLRNMRQQFTLTIAKIEGEQAEYRAQGQLRLARQVDKRIEKARVPLRLLADLKALPLSEQLEALTARPSRNTAMARHDPDHRRWFKVLDAVTATTNIHETLARSRRLEASARRRTWELYEYWITFRVYAHLVERLKFHAEPGNDWQALEQRDREDGSIYGLRKEASITLKHDSGLQVRFTVEKVILMAQARRQLGEGSYVTPDLHLELTGATRDTYRLPRWERSPELRPLTLDAKMQNLDPRRSPNHRRKLRSTVARASERYQRAIGTSSDAEKPMAFIAQPGALAARSNEERFKAWPTRTMPADTLGEEGIPEGLSVGHLSYLNGVLLMRPAPVGSDSSVAHFGYSDVHRLLTAWLIENRVFWVCVHCGNDLLQEKDEEMHNLALEAHKKRRDCSEEPAAPTIGDGQAHRKGKVRNLHIVCPKCRNIVVISHCQHHGAGVINPCEDRTGRAPLIFKQFGSLDQQAGWLNDQERAHWSHEEIVQQGTGTGNNALWNRPCPKCGRLRLTTDRN